VRTPWVQSTARRSSMPPVPLGIMVKLSIPIRFCSSLKQQWSVATTWSEPERRPSQSDFWWSLERNGGLITRAAACAQSLCW
jgi:hypothetical protein